MTLVAAAVTAVLCKDVAFIFQVKECPVVMITAQVDTATLAAVATVGSAVGVVLHVLEVHRPLAALARAAQNLDVVYEITLHKAHSSPPKGGMLISDFVDYFTNVTEDAVEVAQSVDVIVDALLLIPLDERLCL